MSPQLRGLSLSKKSSVTLDFFDKLKPLRNPFKRFLAAKHFSTSVIAQKKTDTSVTQKYLFTAYTAALLLFSLESETLSGMLTFSISAPRALSLPSMQS